MCAGFSACCCMRNKKDGVQLILFIVQSVVGVNEGPWYFSAMTTFSAMSKRSVAALS
jgi:hypothetical protein